MKKRLSLVIVLAIVLAIALPVLASCNDKVTVTAIEFVAPVRTYEVGATIDYDNLQVKVTYSDNHTETKTVAELVAKGATLARADLTKAGNTSYSLSYEGKTDTVDVTVGTGGSSDVTEKRPLTSLRAPQGYTDYLTRSAPREEGTEEQRGDFRKTGEIYEIGNVNKFIFRVRATVYDSTAAGNTAFIDNIKTVAKVFVKETKEGSYKELKDEALTSFVTIEDNTYKFSEDAAGKYVKLEISPAEGYNVDNLNEDDGTLVVEAFIVDGGYNVYDQIGLSVMADLQKRFWSEIWHSTYSADLNAHTTTVTPNEDAVKLEADDQPLCNYVGNIKWVILHNSIQLDPDQMPSLYFWSDVEGTENNVLFNEARSSLAGFSKSQQTLAGTLRSGDNSGHGSNENYARVMDTNLVDYNGVQISGNVGVTTGIGYNMAKGLFCTSTTSVSGNYQSVTYTERQNRSAHGRILLEYVDWDDYTTAKNPISNWSVFLFYQPMLDGSDLGEYTLKNIAMKGNNPNINNPDEGEDSVIPAGIMMSTVFAWQMHYDNVNADQLFSNFIHDNYATSGFWVNKETRKIVTGEDHDNCDLERTDIYIENTKAYNSYSNMSYAWRGHVNISNSELVGSGGPLFILTDADHDDVPSTNPNTSDEGGPSITVDTKSVLQAFATGQESWYKMYSATPLFENITGAINGALQTYVGKTLTFGNPDNPGGGNSYVNVISVMICEPGSLLTGKALDGGRKLDVRGVFTQTDDEGEVVNKFAMHNDVLNQIRPAVGGNAALFPIYIKCGQVDLLSDGRSLYNTSTFTNGTGIPALDAYNGKLNFLLSLSVKDEPYASQIKSAAAFGPEDIAKWQQEQSDIACLYLSAGSGQENLPNAPYFAVILQIGDYTAA